jgi:lipoyl-dependent peroxiredoxin
MDTIKPLFTAHVTAIGGRNGRCESSDGALKVELAKPVEMGGSPRPGTVTPEHLFSAAYGACFGGALEFVGGQKKKDMSRTKVVCSTSVGPRDKGGYGLSVHMRVEDSSMPKAELEALVNEAHEKVCPFSHATRNNVPVTIEIVGA